MQEFWLVSKPMIERFPRRVGDTRWRGLTIAPLVFMTIEELERLAENIRQGDFTLAEPPPAKARFDANSQVSIDRFSQQFLEARGQRRRQNEFLAAELATFKDEALRRFAEGVHH